MRHLRKEYQDDPILSQLVRELPWSLNLVVLMKVKDRDAREFYLREAAKGSWSRSDLIQQIKADAWSRRGLKTTHNLREHLPQRQAELAVASLRESYDLGFLELHEGFGMRVQNSVFECDVDPAQWVRLKARLLKIMSPKVDSLRFYFLGSNWERRIEHHGVLKSPDMTDLLMI
jgi:CRISPR-associated protein Cas2